MVGPWPHRAFHLSRTLQDLRADVASLRCLPALRPPEAAPACTMSITGPRPSVARCAAQQARFLPGRAHRRNSECTTIGWTNAKLPTAIPRLQSASPSHRGGHFRAWAGNCLVAGLIAGARDGPRGWPRNSSPFNYLPEAVPSAAYQ